MVPSIKPGRDLVPCLVHATCSIRNVRLFSRLAQRCKITFRCDMCTRILPAYLRVVVRAASNGLRASVSWFVFHAISWLLPSFLEQAPHLVLVYTSHFFAIAIWLFSSPQPKFTRRNERTPYLASRWEPCLSLVTPSGF